MENNRNRISELKKQEADLSGRLKAVVSEIRLVQSNCQHQWGSAVYDPIVNEAYTIPGDPPGTMGVDWRGPVHVPRKEFPRWKRKCSLCDLVEYTERVNQQVHQTPKF